ncbi:DsbE family thiol:disulfide interchange protein [Usitatibacter palustris]|uniref:Thiol:disulfide interchange protein DsbE n=1 Tax=Usitatibacter palustris TaxID=2732487 RepID=A0A6M4H823_9PROT|nr:DsbE family thiol:disulfide interchange protein [Usitatibacter palustris]QJR15008.1 Thiol:disulfide interchange protein DsbE [Usitatibacter palustris]
MRHLKFVIPFLIFAGLVAFFAIGLTRDPREVPSPLIGKAAPAFDIAQLHDAKSSFKPEDMKGRVWMLNVWASWCVSCRVEHPLLVELAKRNLVPVVGLNYKDKREDATRWLERFGNPYALSAWDIDGRVGIDYGVYGAPETFVIDKAGVIRHKQIGPITPEALEKTILPLLRSLQ